MSQIPQLPRNQRLPDGERVRIGALLRERYESGLSVRQLCAETGYSIGRVRRMLIAAGVEFRQRGGLRREGSERTRRHR